MKFNPAIFSIWEWQLWRAGKLFDAWKDHNLCTDEGLNALLNLKFNSANQITTWYVTIFNNNHTPAAGNTYAVPGYVESIAYAEATRPVYTSSVSTAKSIDNSASKATFTMTAAETIYGGSLVGGGTSPEVKGDVAGGGELFCLSQFSTGPKPLSIDDILKLTVTVNAADI